MSRYKVLRLPLVFQDDFAEMFFEDPWMRSLPETNPVFNRPGLYLDRKANVCWVETSHGCWILGGREKFKEELEFQANDDFILHPDVIKALKILRTHNLLTLDLKKLWWRHMDAELCRETRRDAGKWRLHIQEEIENEEKN